MAKRATYTGALLVVDDADEEVATNRAAMLSVARPFHVMKQPRSGHEPQGSRRRGNKKPPSMRGRQRPRYGDTAIIARGRRGRIAIDRDSME